jgi:urate oxidase
MSFPQPSRMTREAFVARFGGVFEHSPWIAEAAFDRGLGPEVDSAAGLHDALCNVFRAAGPERQMQVVLAHPDLAGRLALAQGLTASSSEEQRSAGLDQCSPAELRRFTELNEAYKAKFGFPFIMAVKGRSRGEILAAFEQRLNGEPERELEIASDQIERIARLRLEALLP